MINTFEKRPKQEVAAVSRNIDERSRPEMSGFFHTETQEEVLVRGLNVNNNKILALNYEYDMDGDGDPLDDKTKNPLSNILRSGRSRRNTSFVFAALTSPLIVTPLFFIPVGLLILGTVLARKHSKRVSDSEEYVNPLL